MLHSVGASLKACAVINETGYPTNSAGGRGASATGPGIPTRGGITQMGAEARRRACGRYSDPSHAAAHAHGCAILRRKRNHWRSGDARSAADAPVQRWAVPIPNAKRTAAKRGGARSGRPRRQSRDCREGRTQAPTPLFAPVVWLGRYWTQIRKHLISERRECDRVSFFNFPYLKPSDLLSYSLFVI